MSDSHRKSAAYGAHSRVAIIGLGYVGLPTAAVVARAGMSVIGVDIREDVVTSVNAGETHIQETDLDGLVQAMVSLGRLRATTSAEEADVFLIAVPTPLRDGTQPNLEYVLNAARGIAPVLKRGAVVILESTSPVGTTDAVRNEIAALRPDLKLPYAGIDEHEVHIAYCPERVLPGRTLIELVRNDRAIGGITPSCAEAAGNFYRSFVEGECTLTSARVAEMVKLAENSFRDVNIAFANELSMLADSFGVDVWEVIELANRHPRVNILQPGPGVGGHCIAVDPWFLVAGDAANSRLIRTARAVNDDKTRYVIDRARQLIAQHPDGRVACFGLAFKPDIDDFRESPAVVVATALAEEFRERLVVVEPFAETLPSKLAQHGAVLVGVDEALAKCSVAILLVDHQSFRDIAPERLAGLHVYDTRGIW